MDGASFINLKSEVSRVPGAPHDDSDSNDEQGSKNDSEFFASSEDEDDDNSAIIELDAIARNALINADMDHANELAHKAEHSRYLYTKD